MNRHRYRRGLRRKLYRTRRKQIFTPVRSVLSRSRLQNQWTCGSNLRDRTTEIQLSSGAPNLNFFHAMNHMIGCVTPMLSNILDLFFTTYSGQDRPLLLYRQILEMNLRFTPILGVFLDALLKPNFEELYGPEDYLQDMDELLSAACESLAKSESELETERNARKVQFFKLMVLLRDEFASNTVVQMSQESPTVEEED
ncbi:uncharacterized protein LOC106058719 [Biomphalaria glabrata]|uniref:Uncharacterized protein LOC106058719 n=1 Tax=Biomphalaria glabrata TaxID=6526 RepID=A0A9W3A7C6_BIOGL|nr:uncharacterized protein LOC106058719 [Biomphalaria glabrata]